MNQPEELFPAHAGMNQSNFWLILQLPSKTRNAGTFVDIDVPKLEFGNEKTIQYAEKGCHSRGCNRESKR